MSLLYSQSLVYALETVVNWGYPLTKEKVPTSSQPLVLQTLTFTYLALTDSVVDGK